MDSEDERWVRDINKRTGLDIKEIQFEEMIDRLEKSCGNQVVSLQEAKLLLKEDDDLIKAVYDYWLQKRLKMIGPLVVQVTLIGSLTCCSSFPNCSSKLAIAGICLY